MVLAIVALMVVIAAPRFASALPGAKLDAGARKLMAGLREARSLAVSKNRDVPFTLSGNANRYTVGANGPSGKLPDKLAISLVTGRSEVSGANQGSIRFFPDGSSTGGHIELSGASGKRVIDVDWLTGRISLRK